MLRSPLADPVSSCSPRSAAALLGALLIPIALSACSDDTGVDPEDQGPTLAELCDLDNRWVTAGAARDGIPSLSNPPLVAATDSEGLDYLTPESRVVGLVVQGEAYAVPHNILWKHEIVNLDVGGERLAVSYCPLTGSSLVFDRSVIGGAELGVSGLIYQNNLIMFERGTETVIWPQMLAGDRCLESRQVLPRWPAVEMTWAAWQDQHPDSRVVSENTGFDDFVYTEDGYPYGNYEDPTAPFLFPMPALDPRRQPKERVLGAPETADDPGIVFPFGALEEVPGPFAVVEATYEGTPAVVLWSDEARGGMMYRPETESGEPVTLEATDSGIVDQETGSLWRIDGEADSGDRRGQKLVPVTRAFTAFWGAWAAFFPDTRLWTE